METKICTKCEVDKASNLFRANKRMKSGLSSQCRECDKADVARWRMKNPEKLARQHKEQYARRKRNGSHNAYIAAYRIEHRESISVAAIKRASEWTLRNPERAKEMKLNCTHKRRAQSKLQGCLSVNLKDILNRDGFHCYLCNKDITDGKVHYDHVLPLSKGGVHHPDNIRVTHPSCNLRKGVRTPEEWRSIYGEF